MRRSSESSVTCDEVVHLKKMRTSLDMTSEVTPISFEGVQVASPILELHPETSGETVKIEDGSSIIITPDISASNEQEHNFGMIVEHMDIIEPLTTLRSLLEQRLGLKLTDYAFYLQDAQELDATKNLVNQCVQGRGLVQINVEVTNKGGKKKINILDVLKPAEEITLPPELITQATEALLEPTTVQKVIIPVPEEAENVTRWVVSPEFCQLQDKLKIPADPLLWTEEHVKHWVNWAATHFNLPNTDLNSWNIDGKQLVDLTHEEFVKKIPFDPGDLFWTHLELLRKCKIVAIIQPPNYTQEVPQGSNAPNKGLPAKNRTWPTKIGSPRISYEGSPGNNGQIQLWQFLLELLTDKDHRDYIQWVGPEGEFKLINPEMVAQLWGQRKNKPTMNYEKLSRALRYYYDGEMIAKVHGKRFVYKFVCDLKNLLGYDATELSRLVSECEKKSHERSPVNILSLSNSEVSSNS